MKDYYLILGIEPNATMDEVKQAYRKMSLKYHPDTNQGDRYFEERFKDIGEAFEILSDSDSRKDYDYKRMQYYSKSKGNKSQKIEYQSESTIQPEAEKESTIKRPTDNIQPSKGKIFFHFKPSIRNNWKTATGRVFMISVFCLLIVYSVVISYDRKEKLTLLKSLEKEISSMRSENQKLNGDIFRLTNQEKLLRDALSALNDSSQDSSIEEPQNIEIKIQPDNIIIKNVRSVELHNFHWKKDRIDNKYFVSALSVKNKTKKTINSVYGDYEIYDSRGTQIDSGPFSINKSISGSRGEPIMPMHSKEITIEYLIRIPAKRPSEQLVLIIKGID